MVKNEHKHHHDKDHLSQPHVSDKVESNDKSCKSECMCGNCTKLCVGAFAIAMGIVNGLLLLIVGWVATFCEWGNAIVQTLGSVYKGFEPSILGGIWGGLEGLAVGIVCGAILACVYNCCLCCCYRFKCKSKCKTNHESLEHMHIKIKNINKENILFSG